ncbi:hypothetical protein A2769_01375 [Candidatus Daviesbacteria bacterium RIFCSPHIGHO2_01_FULL_37_27]|nr:MAG: hypothetical protein A2769_01375 [Candidatus Daviesbacteria bacterium RIFCSPHIGHO2_01_FULL_37_27]
MKKNDLNIGVLGLWHLGCIYATSLAKKGFKVTGYDINQAVIDNLNAGKTPIFEPGLDILLKNHLIKNLIFTKDPKEAISKKKYIFITLDVPVNDVDELDLKPLNKLFDNLIKYISSNSVIVISSQVPVGTCRKLQERFTRLNKKVSVIYFPENLRLGSAYKSFLEPDRIILGGEKEVLEKFLKDFDFVKFPSFLMSLESAEMSKHALNSYLATCISFSSELGDICELTGASMEDVVKALKSEKRVSVYAPLNPGLGFAGGTLGRDIKTLMSVSEKIGYNPIFLKSVYKVNQIRINNLVEKIKKVLGKIKGKKIGLLGLTYKPGTNTLRRSMSLDLAKKLTKHGVKIHAFDPKVSGMVKGYEFVKIEKKLENFFKDLDIAVLMTEWSEFKNDNVVRNASFMENKVIIDTKNFLDKKSYENHGIKLLRIGEGI